MAAARFPASIVARVRDGKILGIRASCGPHRLIGVWVVVVEGRVFVRSWGVTGHGWFRTFLEDPRGVMQVGRSRLRVRAVHTRSERLKHAVSDAYARKYHTPGAVRYVRDLSRQKSRDATIELVPDRN